MPGLTVLAEPLIGGFNTVEAIQTRALDRGNLVTLNSGDGTGSMNSPFPLAPVWACVRVSDDVIKPANLATGRLVQ